MARLLPTLPRRGAVHRVLLLYLSSGTAGVEKEPEYAILIAQFAAAGE